MKPLHNQIKSFLLVAVLAATSWLFVNTQAFPDTVSPPDREVIRALAATLAPVPDRADIVLKSVKFDKIARTIPNFSDWPALRKIETAYLAAVAAGGTSEGDKFLRTVSRVIAEDHSNAISYEEALAPYFSDGGAANPVNRGGIRFAAIPAAPQQPSDAATRRAILSIERYVERVPGGMQSAMRACCGHQADQIYDILRTSSSRFDALTRAIEQGNIPPELKDRLLRLIKTVSESTHAVTYEPELASYLQELALKNDEPPFAASAKARPSLSTEWTKDDNNKVTTILRGAATKAGLNDKAASDLIALLATNKNDYSVPAGGAGGPPLSNGGRQSGRQGGPNSPAPNGRTPNSPGMPALSNQNIEDYNFIQKSVIEPGIRSGGGESPLLLPGSSIETPRFKFETLRLSVGGFGGVVFGAPLDITRIAPPIAVIWVPDPQAANGVSAWGHFDVVLADKTVAMTRRFKSEDAFAAWEMVNGRDGVFPTLDLAHEEGVGLASVGGEDGVMIVHPALYGLDIGDAAAMADSIGFEMGVDAFRRHIGVVTVAPLIAEKAVAWRVAEKGYYKITDAPLRLVLRNGLVRSERTEDDRYSDSLRQTAFLAFQAFDHDKPLPESGTPFYEVLPVLMAAFPAFERLNSFAEIVAIMRWSKLSKVAVKPPARPTLHEALLYISRAPDGDLIQAGTRLFSRAAARLDVMRRAADATVAALRANGAPDKALQLVGKIAASVEESIQLGVADDELTSSSISHPQSARQLEAVDDALEDSEINVAEFLEQFHTELGILIALSSETDAAALRTLSNPLKTSERALEESVHALHDAVANVPKYKDRIAALPSNQRPAAEEIYQRFLQANKDYIDANTDTEERAAESRADNAEAALKKALPPVDDSKIKAARDLVMQREHDVQDARTEYDQALNTRMPPWLKTTWPSIKNLADFR
jgi:hypothetical protein